MFKPPRLTAKQIKWENLNTFLKNSTQMYWNLKEKSFCLKIGGEDKGKTSLCSVVMATFKHFKGHYLDVRDK